VRYRFRGFIRSTGQPVDGHVQADTAEMGYGALAEHGIITESLTPDPEPLNLSAQHQPIASAIDSALDTAASQVPFDALTDKFKGKNVWVLDRDKIRSRVAQVVDQALSNATNVGGTDVTAIRASVADAINGLFKDNRNLTSKVSNTALQMDHQIQRLESFVRKAESLLAQMTVAISRIGTGGGGGFAPRRYGGAPSMQQEQNKVLVEIFKENLRLRGIEIDQSADELAGVAEGTDQPADGTAAATAVATADEAQPAVSNRPALPPQTFATGPISDQNQDS
jgi:hypothetical protein